MTLVRPVIMQRGSWTVSCFVIDSPPSMSYIAVAPQGVRVKDL
jgi:hypothetical protein